MAENDQEQAPTPEAPTPPKSKRWTLIVGGLLVFAAGIPAGLYFGGFFSPEEVSASAEVPVVEKIVNQVVDFDPFVVNLSGSSNHYLRLGLSLGVASESGDPLFQQGHYLFPKLKDLLIQIIGEKTPDELVEPSSKAALKEEIQARLNEALADHAAEVLEVYFTDFIVQ